MQRRDFHCTVLVYVIVKPFPFSAKDICQNKLWRNNIAPYNGCYGYAGDFLICLTGGQTEVQENLGLTGLVLLNQ